jgi:ABC-type uncharacterized transport system permease subunit
MPSQFSAWRLLGVLTATRLMAALSYQHVLSCSPRNANLIKIFPYAASVVVYRRQKTLTSPLSMAGEIY